MLTADEFLRLATVGGTIVCSSQCTVDEIDDARAAGRFYVSPDPTATDAKWGWGFVFFPAEQAIKGSGEPGPATL